MVIDWYFDFISPYAYLQSRRLDPLLAAGEVRLRPILFAALLDHWGQKGPAEIPPKRIFTYQQVQWLARCLGVPLKLPTAHPFNPLRLLRLAIHLQCGMPVVRRLFDFVWRDGHIPEDTAAWNQLTDELGVPDADAVIAHDTIKTTLRKNTDEAIAAGVFGVPTVLVDDRVFWGNDATQMACDYLADPRPFKEDVARILALPTAARRRK